MRVAIVNDLPTVVEALRRIVLSDPTVTIAWTALSGAEGVIKAKADTPDVILMDLVMPGLSGAAATKEIMRQSPCAILVVTATVSGNFQLVSEALSGGAFDAVEIPGTSLEKINRLLEKLRNVKKINDRLRAGNSALTAPPKPSLPTGIFAGKASRLPPLVLIGSSTGGPAALEYIFSRMRTPFPGSIVVAQHIGEEFTGSMASWLRDRSKLNIEIVKAGDTPKPNTVHLASTGDHMAFNRDGTLRYTRDPADYPYRPSVDVLFNSAAEAGCARGVAVLLTGIGSDGARGLLRLRQAGWYTMAQDEASSVVYGMPQAAAKLGAASRVLALNDMPIQIEQMLPKNNSGI